MGGSGWHVALDENWVVMNNIYNMYDVVREGGVVTVHTRTTCVQLVIFNIPHLSFIDDKCCGTCTHVPGCVHPVQSTKHYENDT